MAIRTGTLLENDVERIFKLAGFQTQHQARIKEYEIDVYAVHGSFSIAIECKQFEKSSLNLRNLIHLWNSKNDEIGASKVLLVLWGFDIPDSIRSLAEKYSMKIWDQENVDYFLDKLIDNRENGTELLLQNLGANMIEFSLKFSRLSEETKKITEESKKSRTNEVQIAALDKLIHNSVKQIRLGIKEADGYNKQGINVDEILRELADVINSLYSSVHGSILTTLKMSFLANENKGKIPHNELREFEKFFKKWDKYVSARDAEGNLVNSENDILPLSKEEYSRFRDEIKRMDDAKIIENFYEILQKIEKALNMDNLVSKIDKASEELSKFRMNL